MILSKLEDALEKHLINYYNNRGVAYVTAQEVLKEIKESFTVCFDGNVLETVEAEIYETIDIRAITRHVNTEIADNEDEPEGDDFLEPQITTKERGY